jgi:hypothetical protein
MPTGTVSPPTPAAAGTALDFSGAFNGRLTSTMTTCALHEDVGGQPPRYYVEVKGVLLGTSFTVDVFDPTGSPEFESGAYVKVSYPSQSSGVGYGFWFDDAKGDVRHFGSGDGAEVAATAQSTGPTPGQFGTNAYGPLTVTGTIVCG